MEGRAERERESFSLTVSKRSLRSEVLYLSFWTC